MAVVFEVKNKDGSIGRCDQKCYAAELGSPCVCVCRGENHAKGLVTALENADALAAGWRTRVGSNADVDVHPGSKQVPLWPSKSQ